MSRAFCLIRSQPVYRRDAFMSGLRAAGYDAHTGAPYGVERGDVVLMWNRYAEFHEIACRAEAQGATVLVAENGYVGPGGVSPHSQAERSVYALAIGGHNGGGTWRVGGPERWAALGVPLKPWRTEGGHILVCPNRSFGRPDLIMPTRWAEDVKRRLEAATRREVRVRAHPGNAPAKVPLAEDLQGCWAMAIWSSSAGVAALTAGVPVLCEAPAWICKGGALDSVDAIEGWPSDEIRARAWTGIRLAQLERLAWAQWHVEEIASGVAFRHLLSDTRQAESAAAV